MQSVLITTEVVNSNPAQARCTRYNRWFPMSTNSAPFLANLFLDLFDADFTQELLKNNEKKLARSCYFTFRYDVLILHNSKFDDYVDPSIQLSLK
jgi:hypothetical protein